MTVCSRVTISYQCSRFWSFSLSFESSDYRQIPTLALKIYTIELTDHIHFYHFYHSYTVTRRSQTLSTIYPARSVLKFISVFHEWIFVPLCPLKDISYIFVPRKEEKSEKVKNYFFPPKSKKIRARIARSNLPADQAPAVHYDQRRFLTNQKEVKSTEWQFRKCAFGSVDVEIVSTNFFAKDCRIYSSYSLGFSVR